MGRCDESSKVVAAGQRVAVIGSGIAGQTAAHFLSRRHQVVAIYEASSKPGLHTNSVNLQGFGAVDVPLRAYSPHYYPNLTKLYEYLDVRGQPVNYSSTGVDYDTQQSYFQYYNLLILRRAIPFLWGRQLTALRLLTTCRIVADLLWFVFTGPALLSSHRAGELAGKTLGAFLRERNYSYEFTHHFLYPVMSTLLSCSYAQVDAYPAELILQFYCSRATTIFTGWSKVSDGVERVSQGLLHPIGPHVLRFNTKVASVTSLEPGHPKGRVEVVTVDGQVDYFDHVVIATEPSVAKWLWKGTSAAEQQLLGAMDTFAADIVLHTDASLMPASRACWSGMNYYSFPSRGDATAAGAEAHKLTASMTSVWINRYVSRQPTEKAPAPAPAPLVAPTPVTPARRRASPSPRGGKANGASDGGAAPPLERQPVGGDLFETWNPYHPPAPATVISTATMVRAVWTVAALATYREFFATVQGAKGVWLCGSYCSPGVTLLEQAVTSALEVAQDFGVSDLPFPVAPCYEPRWWSLTLASVLRHWRRAFAALALVVVLIFRLVG